MILQRNKILYFEILAQLARFKAAPTDISILRDLQENIVFSIRRNESRIRKSRVRIGLIKSVLSNRIAHPTKEAAKEAKLKMAMSMQSIADRKHLIFMYRCIADSVAFLIFPRWDIKPLAIKEHPGFLSGKSGFRRELSILRRILASGRVALLCDITNCLRYGDIAFQHDSQIDLIEVKSGKKDSSRAVKQGIQGQSVLDYIQNDSSSDVNIPQFGFKRVSLKSLEVSHNFVASSVILRAVQSKYDVRSPEEGLHYFAVKRSSDLKHILPTLQKNGGPNYVVPVYPSVDSVAYYYPLPLSLNDPTALWALLVHDVSLFVALEVDSIRTCFAHRGFEATFSQDKEYGLSVKSRIPNSPISDIAISNQFLARLGTEFLSLEWFLNEIVAMFKTLEANLAQSN